MIYPRRDTIFLSKNLSKGDSSKIRHWLCYFGGNPIGNQGKLSPREPKKAPQYILMVVQFYAYSSLFTPLLIPGEDGDALIMRGYIIHTQHHIHLSANCSPHTRWIAGGGADSRIPELSGTFVPSDHNNLHPSSPPLHLLRPVAHTPQQSYCGQHLQC